ncbi:unnamed protein product [Closterium sp. Naga37s-1]|nr:unnamed protein product [Closterium sp. Naga37s-1]
MRARCLFGYLFVPHPLPSLPPTPNTLTTAPTYVYMPCFVVLLPSPALPPHTLTVLNLPVKSADPLQQGLDKLTAGLKTNKYYRGFQAKLKQLQMIRMRNEAKNHVTKQSADKMASYTKMRTAIMCVMRGRDSKGNQIGQDHAFGFFYILLFKRDDGDFDGYYGGFVKLKDPEIPIAAVINTGYEGEDGSTVIDFGAEVTWKNASRSQSFGIISWFPKSPAPLGYNYYFGGKWVGMSALTAADGSVLSDAVLAIAKKTQAHYGAVANSNFPSGAVRGQCGIDTSGN